jgi:hypothetical protein
MRRLQLCTDQNALAHPSDADFKPARGILTAFA